MLADMIENVDLVVLWMYPEDSLNVVVVVKSSMLPVTDEDDPESPTSQRARKNGERWVDNDAGSLESISIVIQDEAETGINRRTLTQWGGSTAVV